MAEDFIKEEAPTPVKYLYAENKAFPCPYCSCNVFTRKEPTGQLVKHIGAPGQAALLYFDTSGQEYTCTKCKNVISKDTVLSFLGIK